MELTAAMGDECSPQMRTHGLDIILRLLTMAPRGGCLQENLEPI